MSLEGEIFTAIRNTLKGDATLLGYVGDSANNIRHSYVNFEFDVPCITFHAVTIPPDSDYDRYGKFLMQIQLNAFDLNNSTGIGNLRNIEERIDALLYEQNFATTTYEVKHIRHSGWTPVPTEYVKEGETIIHAFSDWELRVYKKSV